MYVDANTIIELSALLAAIIAIATYLHKLFKRFYEHENKLKDIDKLNAEMVVVSTALLACLDGLKQLGANGKVTEAHDELEKHLNQKAHGQA